MTDILQRLAALTPEHPVIPELREYIRRGFGFVAHGGERIWRLDDKEIRALNSGFTVLDNDRKALIALVQEAAGEIERIREAAQNVIDTFKIGDGIVKDGVPRYVAHAIATTALHQLNQALNPRKTVKSS